MLILVPVASRRARRRPQAPEKHGIAVNHAGTELSVSFASSTLGPTLQTFTGANTGKLKEASFLVEGTWLYLGPPAITPDGRYTYLGTGVGQFSQVSWNGDEPEDRDFAFGQYPGGISITP